MVSAGNGGRYTPPPTSLAAMIFNQGDLKRGRGETPQAGIANHLLAICSIVASSLVKEFTQENMDLKLTTPRNPPAPTNGDSNVVDTTHVPRCQMLNLADRHTTVF